MATADQLTLVRDRIAAAAARAGRSPDDVELVAVSKTHPPEVVRELAEAGQSLFGESKVQEARAKIPMLPGRLRWHLVGHLQRNKIRHALPLFEMIHSVDSLQLARDIDRIAGEDGFHPRVLLEVNVAGESTKIGFSPDALEREIESVLELPRLQVEGLMCIPPPAPEPELARPFFKKLRTLRDDLAGRTGASLPQLSMGMSSDFEMAIEEGATLVRVGTMLFGERKKKTFRPAQADFVD